MLLKPVELAAYGSGLNVTVNATNVAYIAPADEGNCRICFVGGEGHEIVVGVSYANAKKLIFG